MLKTLKLTNFRQHRDRTFNFERGLVVMRGANEAGKSTILAALLYLWFGTRVLGESLDDVVTYGENKKSLRVEGSFTIDGVDYEAYRADSGAETVYGDQRVTGQTGVTQFMERLLGAKADVVRKLMVAEQNSVRGILESDSGAGALIENLADLGMIDNLIEKVKSQLPSGPTIGVQSALGALQSAVENEPVKPSCGEVSVAKEKLNETEAELARLDGEKGALYEQAVKCQALKASALKTKAEYEATSKREDELIEFLAANKPGEAPYTQEQVAGAQRMEQDLAEAERVNKAFATKFETCAGSWEGDEQGLKDFVSKLDTNLKGLREKTADARVEMTSKRAMKINEGVCSFCKKDISDLPEVAEVNSKVDSEVQRLQTKLGQLATDIAKLESDRKVCADILEVEQRNTLKGNSQFWRKVPGTLPTAFEWIGPKVQDSQGLSVTSAEMLSAIRKYDTAVARYDSAAQERAALKYPELVPDEAIAYADQDIAAYTAACDAVVKAQSAVQAARTAVLHAEQIFSIALREYESAVARREKALEEVAKTEKLLVDTEFNNQLIKDLQSARSEIRRRLWDSVTAAISVYFSRIRQVETRITQSEDGFLQNGKPVKGLSGSAKDMLGLAVRAGLLKTFLPSAPILVVDEPFSGCDDARETAGIGVLSALGFSQTLLVTHSDLADSMANQLVQL